MPVITRFYGIVIKMFFKDHVPPHFHAFYGEYNGIYDIQTLEMTEGDLPTRAQRLVKEWASHYQKDLMEIWQTQYFKQLPGLD